VSSSNSSSATSTSTKDGRVGSDNGAIGVSAEGDVSVTVVPDEAFYLGEMAIEAVGAIARETAQGAQDTVEGVTGTFAQALATSQQNGKTESGQIAEMVVKIGLPAAALAFVASQVWGK